MPHTLAEKINRWDRELRELPTEPYSQIHEKLLFLKQLHYDQYIPTQGAAYADYETRLSTWVNNVKDEEDQKVLLRFAPQIVFYSREDFEKLCQTAFHGPITRWLVDILKLDICKPDLNDVINEELHNHTWYCSLSDSMQIADFHHANHIGGLDFRPDWRTLAAFGTPDAIKRFIQKKDIRRVVILEDFIGAGWQITEEVASSPDGSKSRNIIQFVSEFFLPFLIVPLTICPEGAKTVRKMIAPYPDIFCEPIIELGPQDFINSTVPLQKNSIEAKVCDLCVNCYAQVCGTKPSSAGRPYSCFGSGETGGCIVMYSNTPANSLPIIHHASSSWNPLFPRSARIK